MQIGVSRTQLSTMVGCKNQKKKYHFQTGAYCIELYLDAQLLIAFKDEEKFRDVPHQFLHVETETVTQCTKSQFFILRLRLWYQFLD